MRWPKSVIKSDELFLEFTMYISILSCVEWVLFRMSRRRNDISFYKFQWQPEKRKMQWKRENEKCTTTHDWFANTQHSLTSVQFMSHVNRPNLQFHTAPVPQCTGRIYPTMQHFVTEMYAYFCYKMMHWLWDICLMYCGVYKMNPSGA